jgi:hypothetical protein
MKSFAFLVVSATLSILFLGNGVLYASNGSQPADTTNVVTEPEKTPIVRAGSI